MSERTSLFEFLRRRGRIARRMVAYPFVAPFYRAVFKMTPRFWAYVTEAELPVHTSGRLRDKSCHCGWCVECLGWGPY